MIEWFFTLPQETGDYLWMDIDIGCSWAGVVRVSAITSYYKPEWVEDLRASDRVYIYKNDAGVELVICWQPQHITPKPFVDERGPDVWAWAKFNFPERSILGPVKLVPKILPEYQNIKDDGHHSEC